MFFPVPVEIIEPTGNQHKVVLGHRFSIQCKASLDKSITWFRDDAVVSYDSGGFRFEESEDEESGLRTSLLTREAATQDDSALFSCKASNAPADMDSIMITVELEGRPS